MMQALLPPKIQNTLLGILILSCFVFLLYPDYLPLIDLPQHAAQVTTLDDLIKGKSVWQHMAFTNFDTPYLTSYLLWWLLYQFMDIATAAKWVLVFIFGLYVLSIRQLRRAYGKDKLLDFLALTCFFGFAYQWGFISFLMSIPVGIFFLLSCKKYHETHNPRQLAMIFAWGVLLYFSHILGFAFFCFVAYCCFLAAFKQHNWQQRFQFTGVFLLFAVILVRIVLKPDPAFFAGYPIGYVEQHSFWWKTEDLFYMPWHMSDIYHYHLAFYALLILPIFMGYRASKQWQLYVPLAASLIIWYALPHIAFQTAFLYQRFAIFIPIFYALIWLPETHLHSKRHNVAQLATVFFMVSVLAVLYKNHNDNVQFQHSEIRKDFEQIKQVMLPEKRVMALFDASSRHDDNLLTDINYIHFVQWYQAEKHGWVDFSFATSPAMIVRLKSEYIYPNYKKNRGVEEPNLKKTLDCSIYDYLLMRVVDNPIDDVKSWLKQNPTCQNKVIVAQQGTWLLWGNGK